MKALIVFEDGAVFEGISFGATGERDGEVVFNTSMTGYQEILTDPSYKGQIVTMTYPLIGNYGVNPEDIESRKPFAEGFIVKERSRIASNWRSQNTLEDYLKENNIMGIEGVDTRAITRHIRLQGAMKAIISTEDSKIESLVKKAKSAPGLIGRDLVKEVASDKAYQWNESGKYQVTVIDCGVKYNILRHLVNNDCKVKVVSSTTKADEILADKPDGVLLSNGPGDPAGVPYVIETAKKLLGEIPIFGICLGNQMLGLALGAKTYKLKFGHHGGNHPVKNLATGCVEITTQNHGFNVDMKSMPDKNVELTHINLYDGTVEGMRHKKMPMFSVQYHPEAGPGPNDSKYLFKQFVTMMDENH